MVGYRELLCTLLLLACQRSVLAKTVREEIRMPGIRPATEDYYVCTSIPVTEEKYITQYEAIAHAGTAHHILMFGCDEPFSNSPTWECGSTCKGANSIMFAWAKNADPTRLPKDVGYHIGGSSGVNSIVMQVHYARAMSAEDPPDTSGIAFYTSKSVPKYTQGILLMIPFSGQIPPHKPVATIDMSCHFSGTQTIHPFAYRTHAHSLSTVISAYKKPAHQPDASWKELGKGNPQWPQAFYPMDKPHVIEPDDILVGRCVYNSTSKSETVGLGMKHTDEMCNFYMMYYVEGEAEYITCGGNRLAAQARTMPADSLVRLPPNPLLDDQAAGHAHHHTDDDEVPKNKHMAEVKDWYKAPTAVDIGQIGGVDTDQKGNVIVFHRGDHVWDGSSFGLHDNIYAKQLAGAIATHTLVRFSETGEMVDSWGDNLFYLPHGVTVDHENNVWLTDVALHQVFKFAAGEKRKASLTLGEKFVPGSDESHFCKPTDVAVMADGSFFVADGYCNGRILQYDTEGHVVRNWGSMSHASPAPNRFDIVHSLTLSEKMNLICAADREHKRIQCFDLEGKYKYLYQHDKKIFAIAFKPDTDKVVAVEADQIEDTGGLFLLQMKADAAELIGHYTPAEKSFHVLHDVAVSQDGKSAYLAQLNPAYVFKFTLSTPDSDAPVIKKGDAASHIQMPSQSAGHKPIVSEGVGGAAIASQQIPIIVGIMLAVPVLCVLLALVVFKIYSSRKKRGGIQGRFDMGNIFGGDKRGDMTGFSPLTTQEDHYTDSEEEAVSETKTFVKQ